MVGWCGGACWPGVWGGCGLGLPVGSSLWGFPHKTGYVLVSVHIRTYSRRAVLCWMWRGGKPRRRDVPGNKAALHGTAGLAGCVSVLVGYELLLPFEAAKLPRMCQDCPMSHVPYPSHPIVSRELRESDWPSILDAFQSDPEMVRQGNVTDQASAPAYVRQFVPGAMNALARVAVDDHDDVVAFAAITIDQGNHNGWTLLGASAGAQAGNHLGAGQRTGEQRAERRRAIPARTRLPSQQLPARPRWRSRPVSSRKVWSGRSSDRREASRRGDMFPLSHGPLPRLAVPWPSRGSSNDVRAVRYTSTDLGPSPDWLHSLISFFMSHDVTSNVLWYFGQSLVYVATVFGFALTFDTRVKDIINKYFNNKNRCCR